MNPDIERRVNETPFIDTHEHIIEESVRLGEPDGALFTCNDWAYLFWGYAASDLVSAGMPQPDVERFLGPEADCDEKWRLFAPFWPRIRHTGYGLAARLSIQELYQEDDFTENSYRRINEKYLARIREGYYREVLRDVAGIESCQVNSLHDVFCETAQPDLLMQDISILSLSEPDIAGCLRLCSLPASTLDEWHALIDWFFETYGPRAVAVKSQMAYNRRLDYEAVKEDSARPLFSRLASGETLAPAEQKALQDHLFRYCLARSREFGLPVKLHTGYFAGTGHMMLDRVSQNASDLCRLVQEFPDITFVVMHIGYPFQEQMIALAKHYPNVAIDMCWAWIVNPAASVRFVKDFLMAVPSNKLLTFGGDYVAVEQVVGHAKVARRGLTRALSELVHEGWLSVGEALALVPELMNGNARSIFGQGSAEGAAGA